MRLVFFTLAFIFVASFIASIVDLMLREKYRQWRVAKR